MSAAPESSVRGESGVGRWRVAARRAADAHAVLCWFLVRFFLSFTATPAGRVMGDNHTNQGTSRVPRVHPTPPGGVPWAPPAESRSAKPSKASLRAARSREKPACNGGRQRTLREPLCFTWLNEDAARLNVAPCRSTLARAVPRRLSLVQRHRRRFGVGRTHVRECGRPRGAETTRPNTFVQASRRRAFPDFSFSGAAIQQRSDEPGPRAPPAAPRDYEHTRTTQLNDARPPHHRPHAKRPPRPFRRLQPQGAAPPPCATRAHKSRVGDEGARPAARFKVTDGGSNARAAMLMEKHQFPHSAWRSRR